MSKRDYYDVLGLEKNASDDDIKTSYRKLASKNHPDKVQGDTEKLEAEAKFKEAKEAYEMLSDPEKRSQYDNFGHAGPGQRMSNGWAAHPGHHADINNLFRTFFTRNGNFSEDLFGQAPTHATYSLNISLADAYTGRQITVGPNSVVSIPRGARSGTKFYVDGKFYRVDIQQHAKFKRSNDDLLVDVQVTAVEAMLGLEAILEHLDSAKLQFNIPRGIQSGQIVKLAGKGMKNPETDRMGDMLIRIHVVTPVNLTEDEITILETLQHRKSINL